MNLPTNYKGLVRCPSFWGDHALKSSEGAATVLTAGFADLNNLREIAEADDSDWYNRGMVVTDAYMAVLAASGGGIMFDYIIDGIEGRQPAVTRPEAIDGDDVTKARYAISQLRSSNMDGIVLPGVVGSYSFMSSGDDSTYQTTKGPGFERAQLTLLSLDFATGEGQVRVFYQERAFSEVGFEPTIDVNAVVDVKARLLVWTGPQEYVATTRMSTVHPHEECHLAVLENQFLHIDQIFDDEIRSWSDQLPTPGRAEARAGFDRVKSLCPEFIRVGSFNCTTTSNDHFWAINPVAPGTNLYPDGRTYGTYAKNHKMTATIAIPGAPGQTVVWDKYAPPDPSFDGMDPLPNYSYSDYFDAGSVRGVSASNGGPIRGPKPSVQDMLNHYPIRYKVPSFTDAASFEEELAADELNTVGLALNSLYPLPKGFAPYLEAFMIEGSVDANQVTAEALARCNLGQLRQLAAHLATQTHLTGVLTFGG